MKKRKMVFVLTAVVLIFTCVIVSTTFTPVGAATWTAKWIWQSVDGPTNTWISFRKTVNLNTKPSTRTTPDLRRKTKYWL